MSPTNSLHATVVLSFAEDKWCAASHKWAGKWVLLQL